MNVVNVMVGLEVRCEYDLASSEVRTGVHLSTELFNEGSAQTLAPPPNISLRIAGRRGENIFSAKVVMLTNIKDYISS